MCNNIGGGSLANQLAALGFATTVEKEENKIEIPEQAFINPYTFISINGREPDRKKTKEILEGETLYDGYLDCSLEIKSSTYIPNTSKKFEYLGDGTEHYFYDFFSYEDLSNCNTNEVPDNPPKYPRIPGSEIRGMVRNVYEQLTNSCLSVIDEENLPYKRIPTPKKPALWDLKTNILYEGEVYKAQYRVSKKKLDKNPGAKAKFPKIIYKEEATRLWFTANPANYVTKYYDVEKAGYKNGYLHLGELKAFPNKENVFIISKLPEIIKTLTLDDIERFEALLDRYNLGMTTGHKGYKEYKDVYENMRKNKSGYLPIFYSQVGSSIYLSPAMITKEIFEHTISDILRDNHNRHEPCSGDDNCFCPACRLFGMVGKGKGKNAVASRLRFTDTEVFNNPEFDIPEIPVVLGTPRYSATEFYLQQPSEDNEAAYWNYDYYTKYIGNGNHRIAIDTPYSAKLSGRKVYWLGKDKNLNADNVSEVKRNYNAEHGTEAKKDYIKNNQLKMRQAIRALKTGNQTNFKIYFENITKAELGNLLFCINLSGEAVNRIGKGKPLGMGAVKTTVNKLNIVEYKLENGKVSSKIQEKKQDEFKYDDSFKDNIKSILKYLTPLTNEEAEIVDYPRPDNSKDIFRWFVNNRGNSIQQPKIEQTLPRLNDNAKWLRKNNSRHV